MINLIPKEEKKRMTRDFYCRLLILFLLALDFCLLIFFIGLLPSYFLSSVKNTLTETKLENQKKEQLPLLGEQSSAAIKDINSELDLVEKSEQNKFPISVKVINAIILDKRPDIKITQILYADDPVSGKKISILGIAPSREVLLLFEETLENNPVFQKVDLPISNFVKGSNIQFYLDLIPA
jgi:hypothetical protein